MSSAQQKPKGKSGERNSSRRNGKAWKKNPKVNKATGKSIMGYKRERVEAWAKEAGISIEDMTQVLKNRQLAKKISKEYNKLASRPGVDKRALAEAATIRDKARQATGGVLSKKTVVADDQAVSA